MNQYFVKYSLNNRLQTNTFSFAIDIEPSNISAQFTMELIISKLVKLHNSKFTNISYEDIVIEVLTKLN